MKELRFVVSLITQENDYLHEQAAAAQEAAARLGVQLQTMFADNDAIQQSQQLLKIIQTPDARVDAILLEPASRVFFSFFAAFAVKDLGRNLATGSHSSDAFPKRALIQSCTFPQTGRVCPGDQLR